MTSIMQVANSIGKSTVEKMKKIGIDSIEKLASSKIENLLAIDGIGVSKAQDYITFAQRHIERIQARIKIYTMINKAGTNNKSKSADISNIQKPLDKNSNPKVPINSIKRLASSSIEELSKIKGMNPLEANRYIKIARNYLESIRKQEKVSNELYSQSKPQNQILGFINLSHNRPSKNLNQLISSEQKKEISLEQPQVNVKLLKKPKIDEKAQRKPRIDEKAQRKPKIDEKVQRKPRIDEKAQRKPKIDEKVQRKPKIDEKAQRKPKIDEKVQRKPKIDEKAQRKPKIDEKAQRKPKIDEKAQRKPKIDEKAQRKPKIDEKAQRKPKIDEKAQRKPVKVDVKKHPTLETFFPLQTMQQIRFLHFKIKKLEELLTKSEDFTFSELNNVIEYVKFLNINYKTQSQIKIFKELEITSSFYDPIAKEEIIIWDLIFECSRVLWVSAQAYSYLSNKFEKENLMENAIVARVESSKMYKAAAYFSAACTRQEDKGIALSVENLEMKSEEARILAQNLATISEEQKGNYTMAANLSAGLSALSKRLAFLRKYDEKKQKHFKAQYNYDMGKSCHLKAKSLLKLSPKGEKEEKIQKLQKKSNYYYIKAEEIWESMLNQRDTLTKNEEDNIRINLSIVNENIIENDVEIINDEEALEIQDPEPLIIIPENLAPFIPRTTNFLTKYSQVDLNFDAYLRYKNLMSDVLLDFNKIEELRNSKAGIGRTLKQLQILYDNNDIDINSFTELYEKYSIKLEAIESAIQNLTKPKNKTKTPQDQKEVLKTIM